MKMYGAWLVSPPFSSIIAVEDWELKLTSLTLSPFSSVRFVSSDLDSLEPSSPWFFFELWRGVFSREIEG